MIKFVLFDILRCCAFGALFAISSACAIPTTEAAIRCRVVMTSSSQTLEVKAMMESSAGTALDGGVVSVTTPGSQVSLLEYDQSRTAYLGQIGNPNPGTYIVKFRSAAFAGRTIAVPFIPIIVPPELNEAVDSEGNSAFSAQVLSTSQTSSLGWNACPGANVYVVSISQSLGLVYSTTVDSPSLIIPGGTLQGSGTIAVRIQAQALRGDPLLEAQDFSSVSQREGSSFYMKISTP